jgi:hypothetical protein
MAKQKDRSWYIWVYFAGFDQDAAKYTCIIKVDHPLDPNKGTVTYEGDVIPMTVQYSTIANEGMAGLILTNYAIKKLLCDDKLNIKISISKKP